MFNPDKKSANPKRDWKSEAFESLKRISEGKEEVPETISDSFIEFSNEFKEFGDTQKFVLIQKGDSLIFVTKPDGHVELLEFAQKKFGDDIINRGGGFLLSDPDNKTLEILDRYSFRIGRTHVKRDVIADFLREKLKDSYDNIVIERDY